ncbi:MAG: hypothetical protein U1F08_14085 [Steroidobacteraceae bacterium]
MRRIVFGAFALLWSTLALAAEKGVPVYLGATADDPVGSRLAYRIKEQIRKSGQMEFVPSASDAFVGLNLTTLDPDDAARRTVYSLVVTIRDFSAKDAELFYYWSSYVGTCGTNKVDECAESIAADVDQVVDSWKSALSKLSESRPDTDQKSAN